MEAVAANELEARLLLVERISYLEDDRPVAYYHAVHRGDRLRFEVELLRSHNHDQVRETNELHQGSALIS